MLFSSFFRQYCKKSVIRSNSMCSILKFNNVKLTWSRTIISNTSLKWNIVCSQGENGFSSKTLCLLNGLKIRLVDRDDVEMQNNFNGRRACVSTPFQVTELTVNLQSIRLFSRSHEIWWKQFDLLCAYYAHTIFIHV